jgi:hypothetical protein
MKNIHISIIAMLGTGTTVFQSTASMLPVLSLHATRALHEAKAEPCVIARPRVSVVDRLEPYGIPLVRTLRPPIRSPKTNNPGFEKFRMLGRKMDCSTNRRGIVPGVSPFEHSIRQRTEADITELYPEFNGNCAVIPVGLRPQMALIIHEADRELIRNRFDPLFCERIMIELTGNNHIKWMKLLIQSQCRSGTWTLKPDARQDILCEALSSLETATRFGIQEATDLLKQLPENIKNIVR